MMPLDRQHLNRGLQVMVPLIAAFFGVIGLNYSFGGHTRLLMSPALAYANSYMPIRVWGLLFLAVSAIMLVAMYKKHRRPYQFALLMCIVSMAIWTVVSIIAVFESNATWGGWAYPAFVTFTCWAVYRTLASREAR